MYKKNNKKKKILIIAVTIVAIFVALFLSLNLNRSPMQVETIFKDVASSINKVFMYPFTALNKEKNKDQSESYLIQKKINESLEKEIEELKGTLKLNKTLTEYSTVNATILSRNRSYWFNTLTIDKGKKQGIKNDMAVITGQGLIGKISKVYKNSSEVKLLTSDDVNYKVSVAIKCNGKESYAILNGYDVKKNLLKVTGVNKLMEIEPGMDVVTSGLGGVFPAGIFVGTTEKYEMDKYDLSKTVYIKTKVDFDNIHYVTVLKEKK